MYSIEKENRGCVMACFLQVFKHRFEHPKCALCLPVQKNKPLRLNLAREGSRMSQECFI